MAASRSTAAARSELQKRLGLQGVLDVDARTGTPRVLLRTDGALSGPRAGSARDAAMAFVRGNLAALGLSSRDLDSLGSPKTVRARSGISVVRWRQYVDGVPAYDNELKVVLGSRNRVLSVQGSPVHDLSVGSVDPKLSASQALRALMADVGVTRSAAVTSRASGARQRTEFVRGDSAELVLFHGNSTRLAWAILYRASSTAWYEAAVDATTGRVLHRQNLVKNDVPVSIFDNYPGAPTGGTQRTFDMTPYLDDGQMSVLSGPFARTYLDVDDDNRPGVGEEVAPASYPFQSFNSQVGAAGFCTANALCSWNPATPTSWTTNKNEAAVQAHYYVSNYHDHLRDSAVGFTDADGNFEDEDRVEVQADDGAATDAGGGPDSDHIDNANMGTPPDGAAPQMQMYLFHDPADSTDPFRAINGDDGSMVVYHEYTHGLSNRLVINPNGDGALSSPQAGAMGEAWSDWYAEDFLNREGFRPDPAGPGDVFLGEYTDGVLPSAGSPGVIRAQALDCPVGADANVCPGGADTGPGGFTYGDFAHVSSRGQEVHRDGEIWAETLWDLRAALIDAAGSTADGSDLAEQLVTDAMRVSPPEPSYLDMRNSILLADDANNGENRDLIWQVFAHRGMGYFAASIDGSDTAPVEDFNTPPDANGPKGTITGTVTDADSGLPAVGQRVGIAGHSSGSGFADDFEAVTGTDGKYTIANVPAGTYPKLAFLPAAGFDLLVNQNVVVPPNGTAVQNATVRRDWAALSGGAGISSNDNSGGPFGCGHNALVDQALGSGWSPFSADTPGSEGNPHPGAPPTATIELPQTIDISSFGMDPGNTCGDGPTAVTKDFRVETSSDGVTFQVAKEGSFTPDQAHKLNDVEPVANSTNVKFVRLTLLSSQGGDPFTDFSELEVFGGPPNVLPSGALTVTPGAAGVNATVTLKAAFSDPDSAITGYDWDLDGNGTVDRTTSEPTTTTSYGAAGSYNPSVAAKDFRGGSGSASANVVISAPVPGATARPALKLRGSGANGRVRFTVTCDSACAGTAKLTVDKKTARRLRLGKKRTVGTARFTRLTAGKTTVTVKLSSSARKGMRRAGLKKARFKLSVSVRDAEGQKRSSSKKVRIKR